jgi:hypothetical protein
MDITPTIEAFALTVERDLASLPSIADGTTETVTSLYASGHPAVQCPKDAATILFEKPAYHLRSKIKHELLEHEVTQADMDVAAEYGRFPQRPSDLFLKVRFIE